MYGIEKDIMTIRNPNQFIRDIDAIIENKISESSFTVSDLADEAGCSRMSLYRNVKQITGSSPSKYILNKRLWKSTKLISETNQSIREIATNIGFSNPGYFSKKFKEKFNCTPTDYVKYL